MRLDKFLAEKHTEVSRAKVQKAIKNGLVLVNGQKILDTDFEVSDSDQIQVPEFKKEELIASNLRLKVVFENDDCAVVDKPAGLVVHPGAGNTEDTLAQALMSRYPGIENVGEPHRPGIVHRLDEDTSGLILIAKNSASYEYFKNLFLDRKVEKEYLALVHGVPAKKHELIDLPIQRVPLKQKMKIGLGKTAQTEYWVLAASLGHAEFSSASLRNDPETSSGLQKGSELPSLQYSLLRVKLHTGRTHQIRVHLAHIGHPIVGDKVYGKREKDLIERQFLHAYKLKFQLQDGTWIELISELPRDLKDLLNDLGIRFRLSQPVT